MNKEISPKLVALTFGILTVAFLAAFHVIAWTEPSQAPPGGNVSSPINVGATTQYKAGALGIGGVLQGYSDAIFNGKVGIGTTIPSVKLDVNGVARMTGFQMPTGVTSGYVLTADVSGAGTWQESTKSGEGGALWGYSYDSTRICYIQRDCAGSSNPCYSYPSILFNNGSMTYTTPFQSNRYSGRWGYTCSNSVLGVQYSCASGYSIGSFNTGQFYTGDGTIYYLLGSCQKQ